MHTYNTSKKIKYKVKNWSEYNNSLKARGNITIWFNKDVEKTWYYKGPRTRGAQKVYSDLAIEIAIAIRSIFRLRLRNLQGFMESMARLMKIGIKIPDYTTICRRQRGLKSKLYRIREPKGGIHIVIDSTGLKVYGEGQWAERRKGYTRHKMWNKLHIVINLENGEILAESLTSNRVTDADAGIEILRGLKMDIKKVICDAGYDKFKIYEECYRRGIEAVIKPYKKARILEEEGKEAWRIRNENIEMIRREGQQRWKERKGYSARSLIETTMYRYKTIFGDKPLARDIENQKIESRIKCSILNLFTEMGRPISYAVGV